MFCGILATPLFAEPVEHAIMLAFAVVALGLWLHVVQGVRMHADVRWTLGIGVVAINFSAWVVALWFLTRSARRLVSAGVKSVAVARALQPSIDQTARERRHGAVV